MIPITDKIIALLAALTPESINRLPPVERQRFAHWCRRGAELAERMPEPSSGVLAYLRQGAPRHGG